MRRPALPRYQTRISAPLIGSVAITPTLVLVHRAWHREWCWQPLIDHLQGIDVDNVMISGLGLIDGSYRDNAGLAVPVLTGNDPAEVAQRTSAGTPGVGNKAIALKNAESTVSSTW